MPPRLSMIVLLILVFITNTAFSFNISKNEFEFIIARNLFGRSAFRAAVLYFKGGLQKNPEKLWRYHELVISLLNSKSYDAHMWKIMLTHMEYELKRHTHFLVPDSYINITLSGLGFSSLYYALALAADEAEEYHVAWSYLEPANNFERRKRKAYDLAVNMKRTDELTQNFSNNFFRKYTSTSKIGSVPGIIPVFIIGLPFTGLDVLEGILASHSKVCHLNGKHVFAAFVPRIERVLWKRSASDQKQQLKVLADEVLATMSAQCSTSHTHIVDADTTLFPHVGLIHLLFPTAPVLNVLRDPADSLLDNYMYAGIAGGEDGEWGLHMHTLAGHYSSFLMQLSHWDAVLPGRITHLLITKVLTNPSLALAPLKIKTEPGLSTALPFPMQRLRTEGSWRRFAEQLQPLFDVMKQVGVIPFLRSQSRLPLQNLINWDLSPNFAYGPVVPDDSYDTNSEDSILRQCVHQEESGREGGGTGAPSPTSDGSGLTEEEVVMVSDAVLRPLRDMAVSRVPESHLRRAVEMLPYPTGRTLIDDMLAAAYLSAHSPETRPNAKNVFETVLEIAPGLPSAVLGLSGLLLVEGLAEEAMGYLTPLLRDRCTGAAEGIGRRKEYCAGAYRRRGEALARLDDVASALRDLDQALTLEPSDPQGLLWRGRLLIRLQIGANHDYRSPVIGGGLGAYRRALQDLSAFLQLQPRSAVGFYYLGQAQLQLGLVNASIASFDRCLELDGSLWEAYLHKNQALLDAGRWVEALKTLDALDERRPGEPRGSNMRILLQHRLGRPATALRLLSEARQLTSDDQQNVFSRQLLLYEASCEFSLGLFDRMERTFQTLLEGIDDPNAHMASYTLSTMRFWLSRFQRPFDSFNLDTDLDSCVKVWMENRWWSRRDACASEYAEIAVRPAPVLPALPTTVAGLLRLTESLGRWAQLDAEGFIPSIRSHRAFGLAVLEMAQQLRKHVTEGLVVPDAGSSASRNGSRTGIRWQQQHCVDQSGVSESCHHFTYRDFMDIAVRWRQLAEPLDAVMWFDRMPLADLDYSLTTQIVIGETVVVKYAAYFNLTFETLREHMLEGFYKNGEAFGSTVRVDVADNSSMQRAIKASTSLESLLAAAGNESVWVDLHCQSRQDQSGASSTLRGTRVALTVTPTTGLGLSILTPNNISRFASYERELQGTFERLTELLRGTVVDRSAVQDTALEFFYYWVNLGPLSRGTAMTGYAILLSVMVAIGLQPPPLIRGRQLDWEAILSPSIEAFRSIGREWLEPASLSPLTKEVLGCDLGFCVSYEINTPGLAFRALLGDTDDQEEYPADKRL